MLTPNVIFYFEVPNGAFSYPFDLKAYNALKETEKLLYAINSGRIAYKNWVKESEDLKTIREARPLLTVNSVDLITGERINYFKSRDNVVR